MSILLIAATLSGIFVGIGLIGAMWRMLRGPSTIDRIIAIDTLGLVGIAAASLAAVFAGHRGFLDVAFGIALVAFLAAVAFAGLLERTGRPDAPADSKGASS